MNEKAWDAWYATHEKPGLLVGLVLWFVAGAAAAVQALRDGPPKRRKPA